MQIGDSVRGHMRFAQVPERGKHQPAHQRHFEHAHAGLPSQYAPHHAIGGDGNCDRKEHAEAEQELTAAVGGRGHAAVLAEIAEPG